MKKCIICEGEASYKIKESVECYCADCAVESFGDLSYLQKIEEEAGKLKELVKARINGNANERD